MKRTKWLIYTVIIGLLPFFIRSLIFIFDKNGTIDYWLNEGDFIVLGLVLNLTNINELEDKHFEDELWKTKCIGISIVLILLFASILAITMYADFKLSEDINKLAVKGWSIGASLVSFIFSLAIYNRLTTLEK
ncbi:hypothetical protein ACE193_11265 [Bernardetia sp. OM2101]|uniref:hypothetical protein n=1 Tax=Bernardetia sp. OM2101 TaxID=3344876 RepID=UPI0035CEE61A